MHSPGRKHGREQRMRKFRYFILLWEQVQRMRKFLRSILLREQKSKNAQISAAHSFTRTSSKNAQISAVHSFCFYSSLLGHFHLQLTSRTPRKIAQIFCGPIFSFAGHSPCWVVFQLQARHHSLWKILRGVLIIHCPQSSRWCHSYWRLGIASVIDATN